MIEEHWLVDHVGQAIAGLRRRELAIDVGANVGEWTTELARVFSRVLAFEPDARASAAIKLPRNATLASFAIADSDKDGVLHLRPEHGQNSLLEHHPIGAGGGSPAPVVQSIPVRCTTLDAVAEGGADFVKMDIEGAEPLALAGCKDVSRWRRTVFVVECHDTRAAVTEQLWRLGKRVRLVPHPAPTAHPGHCWLIGMP